eukprot:159238-Rhodomonas_salina.2
MSAHAFLSPKGQSRLHKWQHCLLKCAKGHAPEGGVREGACAKGHSGSSERRVTLWGREGLQALHTLLGGELDEAALAQVTTAQERELDAALAQLATAQGAVSPYAYGTKPASARWAVPLHGARSATLHVSNLTSMRGKVYQQRGYVARGYAPATLCPVLGYA